MLSHKHLSTRMSGLTNRVFELNQKTIEIVSCSDDNFAQHLGVMFVSLLENTHQKSDIHFTVINDGITAENKTKIKKIVRRYGAKICFLDADIDAYHAFPFTDLITLAAYFRISIPEVMDEKIEKALYLDCDIIVNDDITKLWSFDVSDYHLGAIENLGSVYKKSGLPPNQYFNSGVMLLNLKKWRKDNISEKVRNFKMEHPEKTDTEDQCALNGILFDKWKRLPLRWNQQSAVYRKKWRKTNFSKEEFNDAIRNPGIIHYIGWSKPWTYLSFHPLDDEYYRYLTLSGWPDIRPLNITGKDWLRKNLSLKNFKSKLRQRRWKKQYNKWK